MIKLDERWKEFDNIFAKPIKEKFVNGIQFPKEKSNPLDDSDENKDRNVIFLIIKGKREK